MLDTRNTEIRKSPPMSFWLETILPLEESENYISNLETSGLTLDFQTEVHQLRGHSSTRFCGESLLLFPLLPLIGVRGHPTKFREAVKP